MCSPLYCQYVSNSLCGNLENFVDNFSHSSYPEWTGGGIEPNPAQPTSRSTSMKARNPGGTWRWPG